MHHIIFIHFSFEEHLGYFLFLAIINKAEMNIVLNKYVCGRLECPLGICPRVIYLGLEANRFSVF